MCSTMIDSHCCLNNEKYKQIDDIIDARKKLGQYNVFTQLSNSINYRFAYSSSIGADRYVRFDDTMILNDGDSLSPNVKQTDSEITIVRVKCNSLPKRRRSKWNMHDVAIPGDGSHLGESPSLVNLATLVAQTNHNVRCEGKEYLVPLSSWDPYYKNETDDLPNECWSATEEEPEKTRGKLLDDEDIYLDSSEETSPTQSPEHTPTSGSLTSSYLDNVLDNSVSSEFDLKSTCSRRPSLAGRISNFIRKRCKKPKTLPVSTPTNGDQDNCKQNT